jgi:GNAT superfamily N-acetyltransferase
MPQATVRNTRLEDIEPLIALQQRVYPDIPSWSAEQMKNQLAAFPQGQLIAEVDGELAGCASSLVITWDDWGEHHTWDEITASGSFDSHNPMGRTLYGAEVFVNPELRGSGVGHELYDARRDICKRMNLKRIIACGRMPGYHRFADRMTAVEYAKRVIWGDISDPVLGFQLHEGFSYCGIVHGYLPEDTESLGHASLIVWLNPDYEPGAPTRIPEEDN